MSSLLSDSESVAVFDDGFFKETKYLERRRSYFFLILLKEKKILSLLDGKKFRATEIFKSIEADMKEKGFPRDHLQMRTKFKNLKGK